MQNRCQSGAAAASGALLLLLAFTCVARLAWGNSCNMQQQHLPLCATVANVTCATTSCAAATLQRAPLLLFRATSNAAHRKRSASQVPQKSGYTAQHTHSHTHKHTQAQSNTHSLENSPTNKKQQQQRQSNNNTNCETGSSNNNNKNKSETSAKSRQKKSGKSGHSAWTKALQSQERATWRRDALSLLLSSCGCRLHQSQSQQQPQSFPVTWPSPVCCAPFFAQARSSSNKQATRARTHSHIVSFFPSFFSFLLFLLPFVCLFVFAA